MTVSEGDDAPVDDDLRMPKLSHMVAARLREQIISGQLKAGSMLMTEAKLLDRFKVSRPTLREALRILEAEQLLTVGRGTRSGATILGPNIDKAAEYSKLMLVSQGTTVYDLQQARRFFEPAIVRSLAGPALAETARRLSACLPPIKALIEAHRYLEIIPYTHVFHEELAKSSDNKAIQHLVNVLHAIIRTTDTADISRDLAGRQAFMHADMQRVLDGYCRLCALLEQGKPIEAADFWDAYLEQTLAFMKESKMGDHLLAYRATARP